MLPTKSDLKVARIQIILTALSVAMTTIFYIVIICGYGFSDLDRAISFFGSVISKPFHSTILLLGLGLLTFLDPASSQTWSIIASAIGVIGYALNVVILINSSTGKSIKRYRQISGTGYLIGIIGSIVGIATVLNTMTLLLAGYILMILSLGFTIKTYSQINTSLVLHEEG